MATVINQSKKKKLLAAIVAIENEMLAEKKPVSKEKINGLFSAFSSIIYNTNEGVSLLLDMLTDHRQAAYRWYCLKLMQLLSNATKKENLDVFNLLKNLYIEETVPFVRREYVKTFYELGFVEEARDFLNKQVDGYGKNSEPGRLALELLSSWYLETVKEYLEITEESEELAKTEMPTSEGVIHTREKHTEIPKYVSIEETYTDKKSVSPAPFPRKLVEKILSRTLSTDKGVKLRFDITEYTNKEKLFVPQDILGFLINVQKISPRIKNLSPLKDINVGELVK